MPATAPVKLTLDTLKALVSGDAVAIRGRATLEPAGRPADKVFPPSHSVSDREKYAGAKYALEERRVDGKDVKCVLLDSVQSQANRMEEALEDLWREKKISLPVIDVDLSECNSGHVTSLSAPHRISDAILRDSTLDGTLFRMSPLGRSFTEASPKSAAPLFRACPTGLVFGLWDSTGPRGGLGSKFARALVSEIVGIGAAPGSRTSSRIDPLAISRDSGVLYIKKRKSDDEMPEWTLNKEEAELDGKEPLKWGSKKKGGKWTQGKGTPAEAVHGNIPPDRDDIAGGVTIDRAEHTVVLSIAALRRLRFGGGDAEARTVLAALGLLAVLASQARGHDLRSRCLLVPRSGGALSLEIVRCDGQTETVALDLDGAIGLYSAAVDALPSELKFLSARGEPLATLKPSPKLVQLINKSRDLASAGAVEEGE